MSQATDTADALRKPIPVRTSGRISGMVELIDFHELTRSVQERFVACVRGRLEPKPIAAEKVRSHAWLAWSSLIVVAGAAFLAFFAWGFGDPWSHHAIHRGRSIGVYGVLVAAVTLGVAMLVAIRARRISLPFDRGVYVFPMSLVDARNAEIHVYALADVLSISRDPQDDALQLVFGTGEVFRFASVDAAAAATLESARIAAKELDGGADPRVTTMFRLDPLRSPRVSSPLGPRSGLGRRTPRWTDYTWIAAPAFGCTLALPILRAHDNASDARMYRRVTTANDVASYRAYLAQSGKKSDFVARVLLPRAELRDAQKLGTVEAIDAFAATHPNSAIEEEVKAAHRNAMLDDLERAKAFGTVAALQDFAKKRPDHGLEVELRAAIHQLFVPALDAYHKRPTSSPQVAGFVDRLFKWSEAKAHAGSAATTIQIRFRRRPSDSLRRADHMVSEHHWFIGEASYPSKYFDAAHAMPREKALANELGKTIREAFSPAVYTVEHGPRLEDGDAALPAVTEPTLFVTHTEEWPGRFDGSITKPRGIWIDVAYRFEAIFVIPGDAQPLPFELDVREKLPMSVIAANPKGGTPQAPLEDKIYGSMSGSAFETFRDKYLGTLLPTTR